MSVSRALLLALLVALWAAVAAVYPELPERMPLHLNAAGEPDRWGPKSIQSLLLLPCIATVDDARI
jgi:uncharacterized membrane protein